MLIRLAKHSYKHARRIVIGVVGMTVLLLGVVMILAPGPAILVIPLGLAILATEFVWAKRLLKRLKESLPKFGRTEQIAPASSEPCEVAQIGSEMKAGAAPAVKP